MSESIQDGKTSRRFEGHYKIKTDGSEYLMFFIYTSVNDFDPKEVGIYMLQIINTEGTSGEYNLVGRVADRCAGIYIPN